MDFPSGHFRAELPNRASYSKHDNIMLEASPKSPVMLHGTHLLLVFAPLALETPMALSSTSSSRRDTGLMQRPRG